MCGVLCCALLALSDVYSLIFRPREWGVQTNCSSAPNSANNSWQISGKCTKSSTQSERWCILSREEAAPQQGGTSQDLRIALTHIKHSINQTAVFHFFVFAIFRPYGDIMVDNLRDPSSDFWDKSALLLPDGRDMGALSVILRLMGP